MTHKKREKKKNFEVQGRAKMAKTRHEAVRARNFRQGPGLRVGANPSFWAKKFTQVLTQKLDQPSFWVKFWPTLIQA